MKKPKRLTRPQIAQICEWYANGRSVTDMARDLGRDWGTVNRALDSHYRMKYKDMAIVVLESSINKSSDN